jgi:hypothetical protein
MGLSISVGSLADFVKNDVEGAEWFREALKEVNRVLAANGLPPHDDEDRVPGDIIGSSQRALQKLIQAAPLLDIPLVEGSLKDEDALTIIKEEEGSPPPLDRATRVVVLL